LTVPASSFTLGSIVTLAVRCSRSTSILIKPCFTKSSTMACVKPNVFTNPAFTACRIACTAGGSISCSDFRTCSRSLA